MGLFVGIASRLIILMVIILLIGTTTLLGVDGVMRTSLPDKPSVTYYPGPKDTKEVFLLLGGAGVSAEKLFPRIAALLSKRGDVRVITYNPTRFKSNLVIDQAVKLIDSSYDKIILVGASMGGLVAYDTVSQMRSHGDNRPARIILIDAPSGIDDLVLATQARIVAKIPFGPISNWALTTLIGKLTFKPAKLSDIHPEDMNQLEQLWNSYRTQPPSGYVDELNYMVRHAGLTRLTNVTGVFIRSTRDNVVKPEASLGWKPAFGKKLLIIPVESTHISFLDEPRRYATALEKALSA